MSVWGVVSRPSIGADPETLKMIVSRYEQNLRESETQITQRDHLIDDLEAALERVQAQAAAGDQAAKDALTEARRSGDVQNLQTVLIGYADQLGDEYLELCREIAAVAFLRGDIPEARKRLEIILEAAPDDRDAINELGHIHLCPRRAGRCRAGVPACS